MQLGARGAQRDRQATRKLRAYSKQWSPGDTMRVFFPLIWGEDGKPDILIGQVWGHQINNVKELGLHTTFIPSLTPFDKDGNPVGTPDITYQFSRIAPIFVNGARAAEIARISKKPWNSDAQREAALEEVKKKYDTKNNREAVKPIIDRARFVILTEVVSAKYVEGTGIVPDSVGISSLALSDQFLSKLWTFMDSPKSSPEQGARYYEIEITYPADPDKGASGRAAVPSGLTQDWTLVNKYPDQFPMIEAYFNSWSADSETMKSRATTSVNPDAIAEAIRNYCMLNSEFLDGVDNEDDVNVLLNNIEVVSKVVNPRFLTNTDLQATLTDAIKKLEESRPVPVDTPMPGGDIDITTAGINADYDPQMQPTGGAAETVPNIEVPDIKLDPTAPRLDELMGNNLNIGSGENAGDVLDGVDIGAIS